MWVRLVVDLRRHEVAGEEVAHDSQGQLGLLVDERRSRGPLGAGLNRLPEPLQEDEVALDVLCRGALGGGADDDAALLDLEPFDDVLQPGALGVLESPRNPETFPVRDVDEKSTRQRDLGGQPRTLRLHRVLDGLDEELLAPRDQILDLLAVVPLALELGDDDLVHVEEPVLLEPDLHEGGLHAGKHVVDDPEIDVPCDRSPLRPLEVHLGHPVVLDHGDALLTDVDRDQQLALGGGQRRPARRLTASLGAAALSGASPVGCPLRPLAPLGLIPRGLLGRLLVCRAARLGLSYARRPLAPATAATPAASLASQRLGFGTCRVGLCDRACLRDVGLSRDGRSFCCCARGRVLLVLLVLPSEPGQRVPLLVVARAGTRHPPGIPASRSGCRKPWPYSVRASLAAYQRDDPAARRGWTNDCMRPRTLRIGAARHRCPRRTDRVLEREPLGSAGDETRLQAAAGRSRARRARTARKR